jgi:hypothetical protein
MKNCGNTKETGDFLSCNVYKTEAVLEDGTKKFKKHSSFTAYLHMILVNSILLFAKSRIIQT